MTVHKTMLIAGAALLGLAAAPFARADDKVDFAKQVEPIFAQTCYKCHGEKDKGGLKLNSVKAIMAGGDSGPALVKGDPDKSDLYRRVHLTKDDDDVMPPKGGPLKPEQQELIKRWIKEGAEFGDWKESDPKKKADAPAGDAAHPAAAAPAEVPLPQVAAADAGALDKLTTGGGRAMQLAQNTNLLAVSFNSGGDKTSDGEVALLQPVASQVFELNLAGTKISDDGLKPIEGLTNLRRLHLEKTPITDAGLAHLKGLASLEYLNLYNTGVTDAGLEQLRELKNLRKLYLWQTKVTDDGAKKLKDSLPQVTIDMGWKEPPKEAAEKPKEEPKKDEPKKEEPKKEEAKKDEPKKDETKKDEKPEAK